ncbi:hypothetical protein CFP56_041820 [Quercus suber]|uniref:Uncharacterized protein n=1 Tax=Quercus suber TaxID=58331 RepID=A0AAW0IV39_QUESU
MAHGGNKLYDSIPPSINKHANLESRIGVLNLCYNKSSRSNTKMDIQHGEIESVVFASEVQQPYRFRMTRLLGTLLGSSCWCCAQIIATTFLTSLRTSIQHVDPSTSSSSLGYPQCQCRK